MWLLHASLLVLFTSGNTDRDFMFPDDPIVEDRISGNGPPPTERIPIHIPERCGENMLLYPGDGDRSAWICDCQVGFVYFPLNNSCYAPYTQGPCPPQHYVVLPLREVVPRCESNPCTEAGFILYNNSCARLNLVGDPCSNDMALIVNSTTFQLECVSPGVGYNNLIDAPQNRCPAGSRRNGLGQCRKMI